ncbi:unnamed protein product, partial [Gadus morhua 'NCC']
MTTCALYGYVCACMLIYVCWFVCVCVCVCVHVSCLVHVTFFPIVDNSHVCLYSSQLSVRRQGQSGPLCTFFICGVRVCTYICGVWVCARVCVCVCVCVC